VSVTELDTEVCEEVEVTVCDGELVTELLIGVVIVGVAPSDVEHALTSATIAPIVSNPNGLDLALGVMGFPLQCPDLRLPGSRLIPKVRKSIFRLGDLGIDYRGWPWGRIDTPT
jgi:hypothetical protein